PDRGARPGRLRPARAAPPLVGAGRPGDPDPARDRDRRCLAGGATAQRGADDALLSSCRADPVVGGSGPILWPRMVPGAGIFPSELTALRSAGLLFAIALIAYAVLRRRSLRNADVA